MIDEWKTLQKNVSKILKHEISIKDLKHIVAVINVLQNAGIDFNEIDFSHAMANYIDNPANVSIGVDMARKDTDISNKICCTVQNDLERRYKRVVLDIDDQMIDKLQPEQIRKKVIESLIGS